MSPPDGDVVWTSHSDIAPITEVADKSQPPTHALIYSQGHLIGLSCPEVHKHRVILRPNCTSYCVPVLRG